VRHCYVISDVMRTPHITSVSYLALRGSKLAVSLTIVCVLVHSLCLMSYLA